MVKTSEPKQYFALVINCKGLFSKIHGAKARFYGGRMKRRDFLKKAGVAAAGASLSPLMFANAQKGKFSFGMVTSWPTGLDTIYGGALNTARYLNELTDGDVEIEVFPAGAQVGGLEVYEAVSSGAFEMGHTAPYYYIGKNSAHAFFTAIPFGLNAQQQNAWLYTGNGQALWDEVNALDNLKAFAAGNTGVQMGGWFRKEINTIEDLDGLKMRIPGLGGKVMNKAGVNTQTLPGGEIYLALERGTIDATEWVGPYDDTIMGFHKVAQYYYAPGWHEPGPTLGAYMNLDVYNDLPADIQSAYQTAASRANAQMLADYDAKNAEALKTIKADGKVQFRTFSKEILGTLKGYMDALHIEESTANPLYAKVLNDWTAFKKDIQAFHKINEYAYLDYVIGGN